MLENDVAKTVILHKEDNLLADYCYLIYNTLQKDTSNSETEACSSYI